MTSDEGSYLPPHMIDDAWSAIEDNMRQNGVEEKPGALESLPAPRVESIFDRYKDFLYDKTAEALSNSVQSMFEVKGDGTLSQVRFLGKRIERDELYKGVKEVTDKLNELAAAGLIEGALLPLATFEFEDYKDNGNDQIAVISYIMLTSDGVEYFDEHMEDIRIREDGVVKGL